jgi:hypothetical protein
MKKTYLFFFICLFANTAFCQKDPACYIDFENNFNCWDDTLWIDTVSNPSNVWEIGTPDKSIFSAAYSAPNAIVTKLDTCYPVNDTSSFIITHIADMGLNDFGMMWIDAYFQINSDTLTDYGAIEFSPDNGQTWINLMTDTIYAQQNLYSWAFPKPVFSGNSDGWQEFEVHITDYSHIFNLMYGDTVLWKYTFISDSIETYNDGWMLDNIFVNDWHGGIPEMNSANMLTHVYPNPAGDQIEISMENDANSIFSLIITDALSRVFVRKSDIEGQKVTIDISSLKPGIYFYKLYNSDRQGFGKFVVE